jgi:diadenosine tetraphosphate (Ap4A) HIT family hydrolase
LEGAARLLKVARPAWQAMGGREAMINATMEKFGYPATLVRDYRHWAVLLRPAQVTLGSLVLAAKSDSTAFGNLPADAFLELGTISRDIEAALKATIAYEKINYLMLMMVDPHVHFHVFPRYAGSRDLGSLAIEDNGWPGTPDLSSGKAPAAADFENLRSQLIENWE